MTTSRALSVVALLFVVGCGGSKSQHDGGSTGGGGGSGGGAGGGGMMMSDAGPSSIACTVDPGKLATKTGCHRDDNCPCGAHCELGVCVASCMSAGDCSTGQRCDTFGRCRDADDTAYAALVPVQPRVVVVRPNRVALGSATEVRSVRLDVAQPDGGVVRLVADPGISLDCPGTTTSPGPDGTTECTVDAALGYRFNVGLEAGADAGVARQVALYSGAQIQSLSVVFEAPPPAIVAGAMPAQGRYSGQAQRVAVGGLDVPLNQALTVPLGAVVAPLSSGNLGVGLVDAAHALSPYDTWTGHVDASTGITQLVFPAYRSALGTLLWHPGNPQDVEALISASSSSVAVTSTPGTLSFVLDTGWAVVGGATRPAERWAISLALTADTTPLPQLTEQPADAFTLDPNRGVLASEWVALLGATANGVPDAGVQVSLAQDQELTALAQGFAIGGPLDSCRRTDAERTAIAETAYFSLFTDQTGNGALGHIEGAGVTAQASASGSSPNGTPPYPPFPFPRNGGTPTRSPVMDALDGVYGSNYGVPSSLCCSQVSVSSFESQNLPFINLGPGVIPCALSGSGTAIATVPAGANLSGNLTPFMDVYADRCVEAQTRFGCTVSTLPSPVTFGENTANSFLPNGIGNHVGHFGYLQITWSANPNVGGWPVVATLTSNITMEVDKICTLPVDPPDCVQRLGCADALASLDGGFTVDAAAGALTATPRSNSGDLQCSTGSRAFDFALDETTFQGGSNSTALKMFSTCVDELATLRQMPKPYNTSLATGLLGESAVLPASGCVDPSRALLQLEQAIHEGTLSAAELAEVHRLFQRWLQLHAFVANETYERELMAATYVAIGASAPDPTGSQVTVQQALDLSLSGWDLFLQPRYLPMIDALAPSTLVAPDYRVALFSTYVPLASDVQGDALPVTMLQTLGTQLDLATAGVDEAWAVNDPTRLPGLEKVLRAETMMRPYAAQLAASALAQSPNPAWLPDYNAAANALDAKLAKVHGKLAQFRNGANPLGLDDSQLPLYFGANQLGPSGRFGAVSDFLLGTGPSDNTAWAPALVTIAADDLDAAKAAYLLNQDRQLETDLVGADQANREDALKTLYGDQILNLCGSLPGVTRSLDVLDSVSTVDGASCYRLNTPECQVTPQTFLDALKAPDIGYQICVARNYRLAAGPYAMVFDDLAVQQLAQNDDCVNPVYQSSGCASGGACFTCTPVNGGTMGTPVTIAITPGSLKSTQSVGVASMIDDRSRGLCELEFPDAADALPDPSVLNPRLASGDCYQGSLGQEALALTSVSKTIEIARSQFSDQLAAYRIAMQSCMIKKQADADIESATETFNDTMQSLRTAKTACDAVADAATAGANCATSLGQDPLSGAAACGLQAGAATAQIASLTFANEMDQAQDDHDLLVSKLQNNADEQVCANDATQYLVAQHTQALVIQQAVIDFRVAQKKLHDDIASVQSILDEGHQALAQLRGHSVRVPDADRWLSQDILKYQRDFKLAQVATYLAVRAVEYEYQLSSTDRAATLAARTPDQLRQVLTHLQISSGAAGTVLGSRPSDLTEIVSIRDAVLQLASHAGEDRTTHNIDASRRLQLALTSSKYAYYDNQGIYRGQLIPFSLAPLGTLGLSNTAGVSLLSGGDCAERLWNVNASILGDGGPLVDGNATDPFAKIELWKSNTFYSQWCSATSPDGSAYQRSSVNPAVNLFADAIYGSTVGDSVFGTGNTQLNFTHARIQAWYDVPANQLAQSSYVNGQTQELAARGLYGDYALFIPATVLSAPGRRVGLSLEHVQDILLRFDYVSVAKN